MADNQQNRITDTVKGAVGGIVAGSFVDNLKSYFGMGSPQASGGSSIAGFGQNDNRGFETCVRKAVQEYAGEKTVAEANQAELLFRQRLNALTSKRRSRFVTLVGDSSAKRGYKLVKRYLQMNASEFQGVIDTHDQIEPIDVQFDQLKRIDKKIGKTVSWRGLAIYTLGSCAVFLIIINIPKLVSLLGG